MEIDDAVNYVFRHFQRIYQIESGDEPFDTRIRELQKELAEELGVTQVTVSSWEHGKSFPSPGRLKQVADVLNTTVEELLKEPGKKEEG